MRPTGSAAELEARRLRAVDLLRDGKSNTEVARLIGVDVSSVKRWKRALAQGGIAALAAKPNRGRPPRLTLEQMKALSSLVRAGAQAAGFCTELWTCRRVAQAIRDRFGVIDQYRAEQAAKLSERSMHNEGVALKTFLGWCAERELIDQNPLASRKFRRPRPKPLGGPKLHEINQVLSTPPTSACRSLRRSRSPGCGPASAAT
jgi:transposase